MSFFPDDMPEEVKEAMLIGMREYVSLEQLTRFKDIALRNPKYFPWEEKYYSLPQSVHAAYRFEVNGGKDPWDMTSFKGVSDGGSFKGLIPTIMEQPKIEVEVEQKPVDLLEMFNDAIKIMEDKRKREKEDFLKSKAIWDKHYSKYGLKYRG